MAVIGLARLLSLLGLDSLSTEVCSIKPSARPDIMAIFDEEPTRSARDYQIGQDLSMLSVEELADRIDQLKTEIGRIEAELASKGTTRLAAEAVFKR